MACLAVGAAEGLHPAPRLASVRAVVSALAAGLTDYAAIARTVRAALASVIAFAALASAVARHRGMSGEVA